MSLCRAPTPALGLSVLSKICRFWTIFSLWARLGANNGPTTESGPDCGPVAPKKRKWAKSVIWPDIGRADGVGRSYTGGQRHAHAIQRALYPSKSRDLAIFL